MEERKLRENLEALKKGDLEVDQVLEELRLAPFEDLGHTKVDHHRGLRQGVAEVIYGEGKSLDQIDQIVQAMLGAGQDPILVTRLSPDRGAFLKEKFGAHYNEPARMALIGSPLEPGGRGKILVATGGTSDLPVAEEAAFTAEVLGNEVLRLYDVGVAGIHRLLSYKEDLMAAKVIIAVAGMEGALPTVIGGLVSCPVIALPTSVGYGASLGGVAALLSMLNSCASGVSVVNIDNGFGAGYLADRINKI
ncbi:MAG: nickel pincer cofactor biosynthesis protein LarB [Tissierellia bacterium]|nr:nickel pincer cofactor biosynthesis protein LarB [Tissierellia bacterium]